MKNKETLTFIIILGLGCLIAAIYLPQQNSNFDELTVKFELDDLLKIELCNPTNNEIIFFDGLDFGHSFTGLMSDVISIEYKTLSGRRDKQTRFYGAGDFFIGITEKRILPRTCLQKNADIRAHLKTKAFNNAASYVFNNIEEVLKKETIVGFRMRINLYESYPAEGQREGKFFDSPWFDIQ